MYTDSLLLYSGKFSWGPNFVLFVLSLSQRKFNTWNLCYDGHVFLCKMDRMKIKHTNQLEIAQRNLNLNPTKISRSTVTTVVTLTCWSLLATHAQPAAFVTQTAPSHTGCKVQCTGRRIMDRTWLQVVIRWNDGTARVQDSDLYTSIVSAAVHTCKHKAGHWLVLVCKVLGFLYHELRYNFSLITVYRIASVVGQNHIPKINVDKSAKVKDLRFNPLDQQPNEIKDSVHSPECREHCSRENFAGFFRNWLPLSRRDCELPHTRSPLLPFTLSSCITIRNSPSAEEMQQVHATVRIESREAKWSNPKSCAGNCMNRTNMQ